MRSKLLLSIAAAALVFGTSPSWAEEGTSPAQLAKVLPQATILLEQGLKASASKGTPISGKYEIENGALQLSVYTMSGGKFYEVIVDHKAGTITKSEAITSGDDLKEATEQSAAMTKAKVTLAAAVDSAFKANDGYRAVEVEAKLASSRPVAVITLMKGQDVKKVIEKLD
jgi:hypothetical protein